MIFVCVGTKRFPFNRLLKQIDLLIEKKLITDKVFAQIGHSSYFPRYYEYTDFLSPVEYKEKLNQASIVISHGGTGALISALKAGKQVIGVPRRQELGEHSDNHQFQIVNFLSEQGYIKKVDDMNELYSAIIQLKKDPIQKKFKGKGKIIEIIDDFIMNG